MDGILFQPGTTAAVDWLNEQLEGDLFLHVRGDNITFNAGLFKHKIVQWCITEFLNSKLGAARGGAGLEVAA